LGQLRLHGTIVRDEGDHGNVASEVLCGSTFQSQMMARGQFPSANDATSLATKAVRDGCFVHVEEQRRLARHDLRHMVLQPLKIYESL
jgi:hypothetical protein